MRTALVALITTTTACSELSATDAAMSGEPAGSFADEASQTQSGPAPGTLTAGAWDDNRNFEYYLDYVEDAEQSGLEGMPAFGDARREAAWERSLAPTSERELLDVALVIDTTGSMGDEIDYLQVELDAIAATIDARYPDADQRWALVVYRDAGDAYVTETTPFTDDLDAFQDVLATHEASGGGDYPEAPERALSDAMALDWRAGDHARLLFWVADAPHHVEDADDIVTVVDAAIEQDVRVYPIAASGADALTEFTMRSSAQLTLGRYLFLTDDSGVGNDHQEPSIPCYFVTLLSDAMLRMVDIEMTGVYREPTEDELIRTGGDPQNGACTLETGEDVLAF